LQLRPLGSLGRAKRSKRRIGEGALRGDEVTGHLRYETPTAVLADGAEKADQLITVGAEGGDIIPFVVGIRAWELLASGDRRVAIQREELLDAVGVIGIDNSRDIKVGGASEAIETNLTEHAWDLVGTVRDRVPITNPSCREGLVGGLETWNDQLGNRLETSILGEDNGALSAVLVDKVDGAGSGESCERGGCEERAEELHLDVGWVVLGFLLCIKIDL